MTKEDKKTTNTKNIVKNFTKYFFIFLFAAKLLLLVDKPGIKTCYI